MLALTDNAIEAINMLAPGDAGLRLSASEPADPGDPQALQVGLAREPAAEDEVLDAGGARVFMERRACEFLEYKVLDATMDGGNVRFPVADRT